MQVLRKRRKRATDAEQSRKGRKKMNIIGTTTTLLPTATSGEDISPDAERDLAKNVVSPGRAQCLGPSRESLNMKAQRPRLSPSSTEGGAIYDGHRDSLRRAGCATAVHTWHRHRRRGNSDCGRRCSFRPGNNTGRHRQGVGPTPTHDRRSRHRSRRHHGVWETSTWARSTVSEPGTVGLRDASDASTVVVGVRRRVVFHNGKRVLAGAELDEDPSYDQCRPCREVIKFVTMPRCDEVNRS